MTCVNIGGLSVGIASAVLLLSYINFELSFDRFNKNQHTIYRVDLEQYQNNKEIIRSAENYAGLAPALKNDFPEIVRASRLYNMGYKNNCVFTSGDRHFTETRFLYADNEFLTMFTIPFLEGNSNTALVNPFSAIVSESFAKKLYGDRQAIGQTLQMDDDDRNLEVCQITGVFKDMPENAHIRFNVLISYPTLFGRRGGLDRYATNLDRKDFYCYVQLRPGTDPAALQNKFGSFTARHMPQEKLENRESRFILQPLLDIHLDSTLIDEPEVTGNAKAIYFLLIIAFFIIIIAWINYVNLVTAGSLGRAKEIGIRKLLGSERKQLIVQFLTESFIINCLSFAVAGAIIFLIRPFLKTVLSANYPLTHFFQQKYGILFLGCLVLGALLSGFYPAFVLSSFKPITVLKGKMKTSQGGVTLRKALVLFQFSLSIFLIIGTLVVYQQMHFMLSRDLGINTTHVISLDRPGRWDSARASHNLYVTRFQEALEKSPLIEAVGMADEIPGKEIRYPGLYTLKKGMHQEAIPVNTIGIDTGYFHALGMKMLEGRNFSLDMKSDDHALIITKSAASLLGFSNTENPIGKQVYYDNTGFTIIGEVNEFHQLSLTKSASPAIFQLDLDSREFEYYFIKIKSVDIPAALSTVQDIWGRSFKDNPFHYNFLDDYFNRQYQGERRFETLFSAFSVLAIIIACLGLFALVSFMVRQRVNEIGVRRVLGANTSNLVYLLTKDFLWLVLLANLIAWPLGWLVMNSWLNDFAYRIQISWFVFLSSGLIAFLIAVSTVSVQAAKAALTNPVKSLRTE